MSKAILGRLSTGVSGLDEILEGGLIPRRAYLVRGGPGTGKTIFGLHFLAAGVAAGESVLFVSLGELEAEIRKNAEGLGFDLRGVTFLDLGPSSEFFARVQSYDIFSPAEVEREPTTKKIVEQVEALGPRRVFVDAITQLRYLSTDAFQFRRQVLSFLRFLVEHDATVLISSEATKAAPDDDLQFISDGIIHLGIAAQGRTVEVGKLRGSGFADGAHSMRLTSTGMQVFPRLVPKPYKREFVAEHLPFGVPELDRMLHGGLWRGTVTMITGPTGSGKTTLGIQFMKEAAARGERSAIYTFEESVETMLYRAEALDIPVRQMLERGLLSVVPVEPLQYTPDEFSSLVRHDVEDRETRVVMIDGITGYRLSVPGADLPRYLRALWRYLTNMAVTVLVTNGVEFITGDFRASEVGISYLTDNIIFLHYVELGGELRTAIGVLKKRMSDFDRALHLLELSPKGIVVGRRLTELRGILHGTPELAIPAERD